MLLLELLGSFTSGSLGSVDFILEACTSRYSDVPAHDVVAFRVDEFPNDPVNKQQQIKKSTSQISNKDYKDFYVNIIIQSKILRDYFGI